MDSPIQQVTRSSSLMPSVPPIHESPIMAPETHRHLSSSGSLLRTSSSAIRSLNSPPLDIEAKLRERSSFWIHGEASSGKKTCINEFAKSKNYGEVIWLDLSKPRNEIKNDLRKLIVDQDPAKARIPMDEEDLINELRETGLTADSLIVFINAEVEHLELLNLLDQPSNPFHMIVVSETQLNTKSTEFKQQRLSIQSEFSYWVDSDPQFQRCSLFFSLLSKHPIPRDFITTLVDQPTIERLLQMRWIYETRDGLMQNHQFATEVKRMRQAGPELADLVKAFRRAIPSPFEPSYRQEWAAKHIKEIFDFCYNEGHPLPFCLANVDLCYDLSSLMADIGYHYTQEKGGNISCARSSTLDGINLIRSLALSQQGAPHASTTPASNKAGKKPQAHSSSSSSVGGKKSQQPHPKTSVFDPSPEKVKECVGLLLKLDPHTGAFGFLFTQLHFQAGRIYHYVKEKEEKQTSKRFLEYASDLARELQHQLELPHPPFELVQIERNGVLYHAIDEGNVEEAIKGYRDLLVAGQHLSFNLREKTTQVIDLAQDLRHQLVCRQQIVKLEADRQLSETRNSPIASPSTPLSPLHEENSLTQDLARLEELITCSGQEVFSQRARLDLAGAYLLLMKPDKALEILDSLDFSGSDLKMGEIELRIKSYLIQNNFPKVAELAKQYRLIDYYPEDSRKKYDFIIFEYLDFTNAVPLNSVLFLNNFEVLIKKNLSNSLDLEHDQPLGTIRSPSVHYQFKENTLQIQLSFFSPTKSQVINNFFKEIMFRLQWILKIDRQHCPLQLSPVSGLADKRLVSLSMELNSKHMNAFLEAVALHWKEDYHPSKRELKIRSEGAFIYFEAGPNRCLKMTRRAVEDLLSKGKLEHLEDLLIHAETIDLNKSEFFAKKGMYRYQLEGSLSSEECSSPLQTVAEDVNGEGYAPSFSDDDCTEQTLEEEKSKWRRLQAESEERLKRLQEKAKLKEDLENQSQKIRDSFSAHFAQTSDKPENYRIFREYSEQYLIQKERVILKFQGGDQQVESKIDAEIDYLKSRKRYLKAKKASVEALRKHRIASQIVSDQDKLIEEIRTVAEQIILQNPSLTGSPVPLDRLTTGELIQRVDKISFNHPLSLIYHTLKHFNENPFFEEESHNFSYEAFQNAAQSYLSEIRDLLRKTLPAIDLGSSTLGSGSAPSSEIATSSTPPMDRTMPIFGEVTWDQQHPNLQNIRLRQEVAVEESEHLQEKIDLSLKIRKLENEIKEKREQLKYIQRFSSEMEIQEKKNIEVIITNKENELKLYNGKIKAISPKKEYNFVVLGIRQDQHTFYPFVKTQYKIGSVPSFEERPSSGVETYYERWLKGQASSSESHL